MLKNNELDTAFTIYWDEMTRCQSAKAYWSLLHITVCIPDICAALRSENGQTTGSRYIDWCRDYFSDPKLTPEERYSMRCKILHQGRAALDTQGRYVGFSFSQPSIDGQIDHGRIENNTLILDVGQLYLETKQAVETWIHYLESNPTSQEAQNVGRNLPSLVRVRLFELPRKLATPSISTGITISRTS